MDAGDWVWVDAYNFAGRLAVREPGHPTARAWRVEWVLTPFWAARTIRRGLVETPLMMWWILDEAELRPHTPTPEEEEQWLLAKLSS
jgi:hypothetical protein